MERHRTATNAIMTAWQCGAAADRVRQAETNPPRQFSSALVAISYAASTSVQRLASSMGGTGQTPEPYSGQRLSVVSGTARAPEYGRLSANGGRRLNGCSI